MEYFSTAIIYGLQQKFVKGKGGGGYSRENFGVDIKSNVFIEL